MDDRKLTDMERVMLLLYCVEHGLGDDAAEQESRMAAITGLSLNEVKAALIQAGERGFTERR